MIRYIPRDDIFNSKAQAIVCPVNTVGVMGAGLAVKFNAKFPMLLQVYQQLCKNGTLIIGKPFAVGLNGVPQDIILFPTKQHWNAPSRIEWIDLGLRYMVTQIQRTQWKYPVIAMPAVGCGLGGLKWQEVKELMDVYFEEVNTQFDVYLPR